MRLTFGFGIHSVEFTKGVIEGTVSLGGSESACLGLARALAARGHVCHIFTTKLGDDAPGTDHAGVHWHPFEELPVLTPFNDWDVFVALRQPELLERVPAKFRILWNQDLMTGEPAKLQVMAQAFAYDAVAYVSQYHRQQWEALIPEIAPIGWVTKNGFDPALVPTRVVKRPNRIIHVSRPERALDPLLLMWPELKRLEPDAELALCRYSSMYDPMGWGNVCADYDRKVAFVNAEVGGITYLGELGKPALYQAIAEAAVMWYPGVPTFAETSCIAAIESQACGTPFVGSYKGALPETVPSGVLIKGDALKDPAYHQQSIQAVRYALEGCRKQASGYRQNQQAGREHVRSYTYDAIAAEWEAWLLQQFQSRYETEKPRILRRLLEEDDHVVAEIVARELGDTEAAAFCHRVITGQDQDATDYAARALDPIEEVEHHDARQRRVCQLLKDRARILDVACGNGAFALALAQQDPLRTVVGVDYSEANIAAATRAAAQLGLSDRVTFLAMPIWHYDERRVADEFLQFVEDRAGAFDGAWCGEFYEHVANPTELCEAIERAVSDGGACALSVPVGPFTDLLPRSIPCKRGHVQHFRVHDLLAVWGQKTDPAHGYLSVGETPKGDRLGQWVFGYVKDGQPTGERDVTRRVLLRPYSSITAGLIVNSTLDLRRCLDAVWPVVDEIVIGNCGVDPQELDQIVTEFPRKTRVIGVGRVTDLNGGFAEARNTVLRAATSDWFFWIDADEQLLGGSDLKKYTESLVFIGYAIKQQHLQVDVPMGTDLPVRLFRRRPDIQFYGCVHEQPQQGGPNGDILPCLQINDVQLAHTGYLSESQRRDKALKRNFDLLVRDQDVFADRELGKLLVLRDFANLALWEKEQYRGERTEALNRYQRQIVGMYEKYFADPSHRFHALATPFYESAVRDVAGAIEIEVGIAARVQGMGRERAKAERVWVRNLDQLKAVLQQKVDAFVAACAPPPPIDCEPLEQPEPAPQAVSA